MKNTKTGFTVSKNELTNDFETMENSIEKKIKNLEDELSKLVSPEKYDEFKKKLDEFQSATSKKTTEDLKEIFEEKFFHYSDKYPDVSEIIKISKSILPKNHVKPNNKLANKMTKDIIYNGEFELAISGKKTKKEVYTKVILAYDDKYLQLSGQEKYTPYDREVYDGVVTLFVANESLFTTNGIIFTPAMVYRAMNGLTENEKVSEQSIEAVRKSLDKSMFIKITIDYTDEAKLYNKDVEETHYMGNLLNAGKIQATIKGKKQEAYKLYRKPILYEYAQISGQIITVPAKLLQTKEAVRSTDGVIVIRGYLLRQIEWFKNEKTNRSDNITYKSIYEELGVVKTLLDEKAYENKTKKIRNHVKSILDEWKEQRYIKNYKNYKEGNTIKGLKITI